MTDRNPVTSAGDAAARSNELYAQYSPRTAEQAAPLDPANESNWGPAPF